MYSGSTITEAQVKSNLSSQLSNSRVKTFTETPSSQYIYYVYPTRLGAASFATGLGSGGFEAPVTISNFTNGSGYQEDFYVYRSTQSLSMTLEVFVT